MTQLAERGYALQRSLGCEVEWLSPEQVQQRYPFYNLDGCVGGVELAARRELTPGAVVNAAGAWAVDIARGAGVDLPYSRTGAELFENDCRCTAALGIPPAAHGKLNEGQPV